MIRIYRRGDDDSLYFRVVMIYLLKCIYSLTTVDHHKWLLHVKINCSAFSKLYFISVRFDRFTFCKKNSISQKQKRALEVFTAAGIEQLLDTSERITTSQGMQAINS